MTPEPSTLSDPADIAAWATDTETRYLRNFLSGVATSPLDVVADRLAEACRNGFGTWLRPTPVQRGRDPIRPTTHLHEINVFGVTGTGATPDEAARSWRRAALNLCPDAVERAA